MAQNNHTSVEFWLSQPLPELQSWIRINNLIVDEREQERKNR